MTYAEFGCEVEARMRFELDAYGTTSPTLVAYNIMQEQIIAECVELSNRMAGRSPGAMVNHG